MEKEILNGEPSVELKTSQEVNKLEKILHSSPSSYQNRPTAPLSDYSSPVKGTKSIASFFTPPVIQNFAVSSWKKSPIQSSSLKDSPVKVNSVNKSTLNPRISPVKIIEYTSHTEKSPGKITKSPVTPIIPLPVKSISPQKSSVESEDSGSDLTLSEDEKVNIESESEKENISIVKFTAAKPVSSRSISLNYSDSDSEEQNKTKLKRNKISNSSDSEIESTNAKSEEASDISVIISLPSTDSNSPDSLDRKPAVEKFIDFSNSEYESFEDDEDEYDAREVKNIPIVLGSGDEKESEQVKAEQDELVSIQSNEIDSKARPSEFNEIPLKVFNFSNQASQSLGQITSIKSPQKNLTDNVFNAKKSELPESIAIKSAEMHQNITPMKVSCNQVVAEIETQRVATLADEQVQRSLNLPDPVPKPLNPQISNQNNLPIQENRSYLTKKTPHVPVNPAQSRPRIIEVETKPPLAPSSNSIPSCTIPTSNHQISYHSKTGFVYDERMLLHFDPHDPEHPEKPARITSIYDKLRAAELLNRSVRIPITIKLSELAPEIQAIHDLKYCRMVNQTSIINNVDELLQASSKFNSVYFNTSTAIAATVAASATIELCDAIGRGDIENGFAIVRPPGHHAEHDEAMGFCIYNNVAVAAKSLIRKKLAKRILILDWDVHHGNGTQNAFADSSDVLYVSLHRYDGGKFYPHIEVANHNYVGTGAGLGKSVNIAWNGPGYGDADYLHAFSRLIMPIAREYNPDFVIVSAGFDAAAGDPIGECELTTYGYSIMLQELMTLAGGRLALVLEGGYNLEVISKCYEACVRTLLKESHRCTENSLIASPKAILAIENSISSLSPYWKCLFPKPAQLSINENTPQIPLSVILDNFWREECKKNFGLNPITGLLNGCSDLFIKKYSNRILASDGILFDPEVLIIFAHETGPIHTNSFVSSLCLQSPKINQSQPFLPLIQYFHGQPNYSLIDINLVSRVWKLKQTSLGYESEAQELNLLFSLLWDRIISRSGCKNVFFIASGSPIYSIGNLINTKEVETQLRGCFLFSSSLFVPIINSSPSRSEWYQNNTQVIVPSQEPIRKAIKNAPPAFGSCFSSGQWLMADSAAAVGDFKMEIFNFIRTRLQKN